MLVYQLLRGKLRSELRLFDLTTNRHRRSRPDRRFEVGVLRDGVGRLDPLRPRRGVQPRRVMVLFRNLATGEQRVLDVLQNRRSLVTAGPGKRELRRLAALQPTPALPNLPLRPRDGVGDGVARAAGKDPLRPLGELARDRLLRAKQPGCGKSVRREAAGQRAAGDPPSLPQGRDVAATYAHQILKQPPRELITTRIYYDFIRCKGSKWDIYSLDTTERIPLPPSERRSRLRRTRRRGGRFGG